MCSYGLRMYISAVEKQVELSFRTDFPIGVLRMALVEPRCRGFRSVRGLLRRPLINLFDATYKHGQFCRQERFERYWYS